MGIFKNLKDIKLHTFFNVIKWKLLYQSKTKKTWPAENQLIDDNLVPLQCVTKGLHVSYVGHVTFLIQINGFNILTDPMWSERASPFSWIGPKRIKSPGVKMENLPPIDIIIISHNHYDHLDIPTLIKLHKLFKPKIIVPIGNAKVIKKHIKDADVIELNWYENVSLKSKNNNIDVNDDLDIVEIASDDRMLSVPNLETSSNLDSGIENNNMLTDDKDKNINFIKEYTDINSDSKHIKKDINIYLEPAQHWSARTLWDKNHALWGTFIIESELDGIKRQICFIGDSGYDSDMFKSIGDKYPKIFLSLIPIGAYLPRFFMQDVHMDPHEAVLAFKDLKSEYAIGSHYDVFPLADDSYGQALDDLSTSLQKLNIDEAKFLTLEVGQRKIWST